MANPWIEHVKKFREAHPDMKYKDCLAEAKKSYTPVKKSASAKTPKVKKGGALKLAGQGSCGSGIVLSGAGIADVVYKNKMKKLGVRGMDNLYPGELHAPLLLSDGKLTAAAYVGPGTNVLTRVARGVKGLTMIDELARRHDSLYGLSKTKKDVRRSDEDFLKILKSGVIKDNAYNKKVGDMGIGAKYGAETLTGVKFPSSKELKANDPTNQDLINVILETNKMFGVNSPFMIGKGLRLAGEGLRLSGQGLGEGLKLSGEGILDQLQKMVDWIFGRKKTSSTKPEKEAQDKAKSKCKMMLEKHGIVDKRSFKRWALKNHPDKVSKERENEATELFKAIKNCMEEEQVGQGFFDSLSKGFSLAGDIATGIVKDPVGSAEMIGETFSKKDTWDAIDKHFREDEGFQKALGITTAITDKLEKVLGAIPGVGQISDVVFKGWDKLTGEYKAKPGAKLTNKMRDWGYKADE